VFVSRLLFAAKLLVPAARLRAKTLLSGGVLLDAILAANAVLAAGGTLAEQNVEMPRSPGDGFSPGGTIVAVVAPYSASQVLNDHLFALNVCLQAWERAAARFVHAPQRDAVFAALLAHYLPSARSADEALADAPRLHGTCLMVFQTLTSATETRAFFWTPALAVFRQQLLFALTACLAGQAAEACTQPLSARFAPREVHDACFVLNNCVAVDPSGLVRVWSLDESAAHAVELCAAGVPGALLALLDVRSVLLRSATGAAANALTHPAAAVRV
jgi:hypothetical protein